MSVANRNTITREFNAILNELVAEVEKLFPNNVHILSMKKQIKDAKSINPTLIIGLFKAHILPKYGADIRARNFSSFIDRDFEADLDAAGPNAAHLRTIINAFQKPLRDHLNNTDITDRIVLLNEKAALYIV